MRKLPKSLHSDFTKMWQNYKVWDTDHEEHGKRLLNACKSTLVTKSYAIFRCFGISIHVVSMCSQYNLMLYK